MVCCKITYGKKNWKSQEVTQKITVATKEKVTENKKKEITFKESVGSGGQATVRHGSYNNEEVVKIYHNLVKIYFGPFLPCYSYNK